IGCFRLDAASIFNVAQRMVGQGLLRCKVGPDVGLAGPITSGEAGGHCDRAVPLASGYWCSLCL
ncbi:MAG: hypothetical protein FWD12_13505, partial [Alphaproteobacteria bacterium]|nr:hypothetical protein [Alphaproteobacteria bacterium]